MYTSGSTGKPKAVMIESSALTAYCLADIAAYHVTESDRTLHFSTINFDIAIEEIFPPLLTGQRYCGSSTTKAGFLQRTFNANKQIWRNGGSFGDSVLA
jgi:non-ribosomal peptide synthetase component F